MDELEFLKQDWKRQEADLPVVSTDSIYEMTHKRSSSLMKWLLYVSIFEFVFWTFLNVLGINAEQIDKFKELHLLEFDIVLTIIQYAVLGFFIYCFYKTYKEVETTSSTRKLMKNILRVRKIVNAYVIYNLAMVILVSIVVFVASAAYDPKFDSLYVIDPDGSKHLPLSIIATFTGFILIFTLVIWLFYKLLYGILLKRLKDNYKKLSKLEMEE
ncbi:MAG: hypothetical protein COA80_05605 [Leeuwenhoekiella sp.]|uniref:Beta-carotene 15,15'-monooxygenase n=1 Tax=Leeuwenhoekiella nanhaiensis TaxID=1655491 RepID=A0A2G1VPZ4_9FLAO|nr:hypothetical protein [Leeuwenhoekiella nanhaiensis]PHQ28848.1 hypothetical protein CJ305_13615 [Leeuwenhoekiella nanhaiensis]PHR98374.1 MAG: hypothetical protein COA80_05605 [Leeuwenhoekiella sp.]